MIHEDIQLTGSFQASGSFTLPNHATSASITNPTTGSTYNDTTNNVVKVYNGTEWVTVGEQIGPVSGADLEYLLVAGGGGAGFDLTGAGGAGGLLSSSLSSVESGSSFTVTVGSGGAGYTSGGVSAAADGTDSSIAGTTITTITSIGGGGGSRVSSNPGRDGGSGGGCGRGNQGVTSGGSGTVGQGNDGGADSDSPAGTGGGGAGADGGSSSGGGNPATGGAGGDGKASAITGTSTSYAGGGGGGGYYGSGGAGGTGGGGTGGTGNAQNNATNGTTNTGGGAGGGEQNSSVARSGGSGVAIFAYDTGSLSGLGGTKTLNGGRMVHTFNSSGTLTIAGTGEYPVANASVFNTVLYTGNGGTQAITNVGFQPDMVWIKPRNPGDNHNIFDVIRGVTKQILPNGTSAESTQPNTLQSFDSNGFTTGPDNNTNLNNTTYVAWTWKAGGQAVSNTEGTITSQVSANVDAGFSILKYTGNGNTAQQSYGHGLSSAPELLITKNIDTATQGTNSWVVGGTLLGNGGYMLLNSTNAKSTASSYNGNKVPDSEVIYTSGTSDLVGNQNGINFITYAFHSVDGYQKVGSYTGTGSTGNVVTTGFQPRFVIIKRTNSAADWLMYDYERTNTYKPYLLANSSAAEDNRASNDLDFVSTGFELLGSGGGTNGSSDTYIYLAIG